jgi:hypothetical protein
MTGGFIPGSCGEGAENASPIAEDDEVESNPYRLDAFPVIANLAGLGVRARKSCCPLLPRASIGASSTGIEVGGGCEHAAVPTLGCSQQSRGGGVSSFSSLLDHVESY